MRLGSLVLVSFFGMSFALGCAGNGPVRQQRSTEARGRAPIAVPMRQARTLGAAAAYALGALPAELAIRFPAPPRIQRELIADDRSQPSLHVRRPGTAVIVRRDLRELIVAADDVEVRAHGRRIDLLRIERGRRRIRVVGGVYGAIELPVPAQHVPPPARWRPEWLAEDVTIDGVEVRATDTAFALRGRRIAILRSRVEAARYSVWCGDTQDFHSEDVILAGNHFASAGPESTVRLVNVRRAVVVDNRLENGFKHDFRVHGDSDGVVFARNQVLHTGIMLGSMEGDRIGSVWLLDNRVFHRAPSLLEIDEARVRRLIARGNRIYSDRWRCFVCGTPASGWRISDNPVAPYRPPDVAAWRVAARP